MKSQGISFQTKSGHPVICVKSFQNWTRGFGGVVIFKSIVNGRPRANKLAQMVKR